MGSSSSTTGVGGGISTVAILLLFIGD